MRRLPLIGLLLAVGSVVPSAAGKPNIVYLVADDLGWRDVGFHGGGIDTPHLDRLAAEGVRLDQFYAQPTCSPTRGALLTGRYPIRLGLQVGVVRPWSKHGLPLDERTLAEALRDAGYFTAMTGKWHLGHGTHEFFPTRRGFDHQHGYYNGAVDYFTHRRERALDWHRNDRSLPEETGYATSLIGAEAVRIIENHDPARPLFLYVPFGAPHPPYQAPESYIARYRHLKTKGDRIFAAMVACMDDAIGGIVAALDERGWRENTLILFHSDNGGSPIASDNGSLRGGKDTLYEGGVRVVALASWPGTLPAGGNVAEPMHAVDMYPTLVGLAGGSLDHERQQPLDGVDVWPVIARGGERPGDTILLNSNPFHGAVRVGDLKLVKNGAVPSSRPEEREADSYELFDLADDPFEERDLAASRPRELEALKAVLARFEGEAVPPNISPTQMPPDFRVPEIWGQR
jgi:arylsulfatase A-like enzyme